MSDEDIPLENPNSTFTTDIRMGDTYRDTVTGFTGKVTSIHFYRDSCERVVLERYEEKNAKMLAESFDAPRLEHLETKQVARATKTGGPGRIPDSRTLG